MSRTYKDQHKQNSSEHSYKNSDKKPKDNSRNDEREMIEDFYNSFWN